MPVRDELQFLMLGPLEVRRGAAVVAVPAPKQRALLALLLIRRDQVVSTDELIDQLWGDSPPAGGNRTLRFHVSKLRTALEPGRSSGDPSIVQTRTPGYVIEVGDGGLDVLDVEAALAEARGALPTDPDRSAAILREALAIWRGPALADMRYEAFAAAEIHYLDDLRLVATEERIEADLAAGRGPQLIGELGSLITEHPLREALRGQLMRALYAGGRQAEALRHYRDTERELAELGLEPGPELRRLEEQILLHDADLVPAPAVPTPVQPKPSLDLPADLSSFVGREVELAQVRDLAAKTRLLTLTGAGGCGKTRLAIEAIRSMSSDAGARAALVLLGGLGEATVDAVAAGALEQIGGRVGDGDALTGLVGMLRDRAMYLVLDNCEHLGGAVGAVAAAVLSSCAGVRVIATSRQPLGVAGEATYRVPSMSLPPPDGDISNVLEADAGRLLVERVRATDPAFAPGDAFAVTLADICTRLDGIPLAIELAAARFRHLTPEEVAARLADRFRLLTDGGTQVLPRQRTLEATVAWSYDLLSEAEQAAFVRLAVFRGGWTVESAEKVIAGDGLAAVDVLGLLGRLVDRSLVQVERGSGARSRYWMLETLREYALARLAERGETSTVQAALASYLVDLAEHAEAHLRGPEEAEWLVRLDEEADNLRAAMAASLERGAVESVLLALGALKLFLVGRPALARPARSWLEAALAQPADLGADRLARAYSSAGALAWAAGDLDRAEELHSSALGSAREGSAAQWEFRALNDLGLVALDRGDRNRARRHFEGSVAVAREGQNLRDLATALAFQAQVARPPGQRDLLLESLALQRQVGRASGVAHVTAGLAWLAFHRLDLEESATWFAESAAEWDRLGNDEAVALSMCGQADIALLRGSAIDARRLLDDALLRAERAESPHVASLVRYRLAEVARRAGDPDAAGSLLDTASRSWEGEAGVPGAAMVLGLRAAMACDTGEADAAGALAAQSVAVWSELNRPDGVAWALLAPGDTCRPGEQDGRPAGRYAAGLAALREALAAPVPIDGWSSPETCLGALAVSGLLGVARAADPATAARLLGAVQVVAGRDGDVLREALGEGHPPEGVTGEGPELARAIDEAIDWSAGASRLR